MRRSVVAIVSLLVLAAMARPALAQKAGATPWATVEKLAHQSYLIAVVQVKAVDVDEHTMTLDVKRVVFSEKKPPKRLIMTYFAGDDLEDRVQKGSRALAFLVLARKRWTPAYVDSFAVWPIEDEEVIEWIEGKPRGYFYSVEEVASRVAKFARKRPER